MEPTEQIISWLKDAHAMEQTLENVLERHAKDAADFPHLREQLERHLAATRDHASRIEGALQRLGESPSMMKSMAGGFMGAMQGMSTAIFDDELVKNALADYAMEHFEIACYNSLIAAADEIGLAHVASTCRDILREEIEMANWLEKQIPQLTRTYLQQSAAR